ncbi:MAG: sigma-70 family RNA polymerase sigma factor [Clostridia bacterium]|nr:sigma-70 family RNA polymerase sigma factor [Clostridia bacterium]
MEEKRTTEQCSDEQLVILSQGGNRQATEELLLRYAPLVRRRARCFFLVGGETEDLIQEGMFGLLKAISEYAATGQGSFSGFAYLCVTRRIVDAVKASARLKNVPLNNYVSIFDSDSEPFADNPGPEDEMLRKEDRREFLGRMSRVLSDFEFRVIVMYMDGMSSVEICQATGKDGKSIDNAIQRSKKKLQKIIKR